MAASVGLVSVETRSLVVSGVGTRFVAAEGDQLILGGLTALIARQISPTQIQLKYPWPGATVTAAADWDISLTSPYWNSQVVATKRLSDLLTVFEAGPLKPDQAGPPSDRAKYNDQPVGFIYLSTGEPWTAYTKLANTNSDADWSPGQEIRGSAAVSTVEATAARDDAQLAASRAGGAAGVAQSAASSASRDAAVSAAHAASTIANASAAASAAGDAAYFATLIGSLIFDMGTLDQVVDGSSTKFDFGSL